LQDRVKFAGFTEKPWEVYPAFDVFIMPSRTEGLPLALLEAMACGCPSIAMGVGGIPEIITEKGLGWIVQPGDRVGFLAAMRGAVESDPGERGRMGWRAREHVVRHFNAKEQFFKLTELIEDKTQGTAGRGDRLCGEIPSYLH
jgi:L-malate glycosyltransferase